VLNVRSAVCHFDLISVQVIVKDSNVVCVAEAAACVANLAKGLRKEFATSGRAMFPNLLDKLKDKNSAVCAQSAKAVSDIHRQDLPSQTPMYAKQLSFLDSCGLVRLIFFNVIYYHLFR
jgi:hypothetical protein